LPSDPINPLTSPDNQKKKWTQLLASGPKITQNCQILDTAQIQEPVTSKREPGYMYNVQKRMYYPNVFFNPTICLYKQD